MNSKMARTWRARRAAAAAQQRQHSATGGRHHTPRAPPRRAPWRRCPASRSAASCGTASPCLRPRKGRVCARKQFVFGIERWAAAARLALPSHPAARAPAAGRQLAGRQPRRARRQRGDPRVGVGLLALLVLPVRAAGWGRAAMEAEAEAAGDVSAPAPSRSDGGRLAAVVDSHQLLDFFVVVGVAVVAAAAQAGGGGPAATTRACPCSSPPQSASLGRARRRSSRPCRPWRL